MNWRNASLSQFDGKAVFILRNPVDAILSYWNYKFSGFNHTGFRKVETKQDRALFTTFVNGAKQDPLDDLVEHWSKHQGPSLPERWRILVQDWLPGISEGRVHLVLYEDLKRNPVAALRGILEYLDISGLEDTEFRLNCIHDHLSGSFHRAKAKQKGRDKEKLFEELGLMTKIRDEIDIVKSLVAEATEQKIILDYWLFKVLKKTQKKETNLRSKFLVAW